MVKSIRAETKGWNIKKEITTSGSARWTRSQEFPTDNKAIQEQNRATREDPQVCNSGQEFPLEMQ